MKKLILILATSISLFSCSKKEEVKPQTTTTTTQTSTSTVTSNCNKDSSWTRSHPKTKSLYYFKETCTHITITYAVTKRVITIEKPVGSSQIFITNYPNYSNFRNSTDPNKFYYEIRLATSLQYIIYSVEEANNIGVGGPGMKMK